MKKVEGVCEHRCASGVKYRLESESWGGYNKVRQTRETKIDRTLLFLACAHKLSNCMCIASCEKMVHSGRN